MTSDQIKRHLADRYTGHGWMFFPELSLDYGCSRIDGWAVNPYGMFETLAFEIKVSRGDFLREVRNKAKNYNWRSRWCQEFWFVTPKGLIGPEEVPDPAGLMYSYPSGVFRRIKKPVRNELSFYNGEMMQLLRRCQPYKYTTDEGY